MRAVLSILAGTFLFASSCNSKKDTLASSIIKGEETTLVSSTAGSRGSIIRVDKAGDALDHLSIEIPNNAFKDESKIFVSSSAINSHQFGDNFSPLTPLIKISSDAGEPEQLLTVHIPVEVPDGKFAMAFQYNDRTGELDGLPFVEQTEPGTISIAFRSLPANNKKSYNAASGFAGNEADVPYAEIVVACVDEMQLSKTIVSGFRAGVDDWIFPNYGSHIAPDGHCSGQTIGMLWYYYNKKAKGSPPLYNRFDNDDKTPASPSVWYDDVLAYKYCSVLQTEWSFEDENEKFRKWQKNNDTRSYMAFAYSILITGQPQLAIIFPSGDTFSHAILVYGVRNDSLLIVDPNKPGNGSLGIQYRTDDKVFQPYFTGQNAGDQAAQYHYILYYSKSVLKSWNNAGLHWQEFASRTIGDEQFPSFEINALNDNDEFVKLSDGFTLPLGGRLTTNVRSQIPVKYYFLDSHGTQLRTEDENSVSLQQPGLQRIGIVVVDANNYWVGFKWFEVDNPSPALPETPTGSGRVTLTLTVDGASVPVDSAKYVIHDVDGLSFSAWGERFTEGAYAYTFTFDMKVHEFRSPRVYQLTGEPGTMFWQYSSFYIKSDKPGMLDVTEWNGRSFAGSFSFEADDGYGKLKKVEGRFY